MNQWILVKQNASLKLLMFRETGMYRIGTHHGESVRAFVPRALPPAEPPLAVEGELADRHAAAVTSIGRLRIAGAMVPDPGWFLYGFVRKEVVLSSQIEGTQATLRDVATFEATSTTDRPADVGEICNEVTGLNHARATIADSAGLLLSTRLLCDVQRILRRGLRAEDKRSGEIRRSQNWIGGTRPGNALSYRRGMMRSPPLWPPSRSGCTPPTRSRPWSRPGLRTSSARRSIRSSMATAASAAC